MARRTSSRSRPSWRAASDSPPFGLPPWGFCATCAETSLPTSLHHSATSLSRSICGNPLKLFRPTILRGVTSVVIPKGVISSDTHRASRCYPGCMCRSYFDSKVVYFAIRPMCHKRGLRASGGECGPVCAMWCFFIEQAGVEEPIPFFLPGKRKRPGSFHHPAICTAPYCLCLRHGCQPIFFRPHAGGQQ